MALKIRWTKKAADSLEQTANYIENEWGTKSINKLIRNLNNFLTLVKQYPLIGKIEIEKRGIRGFVISRHNSILYRIKEQEIVILKFFDNRQNPQKKSYSKVITE